MKWVYNLLLVSLCAVAAYCQTSTYIAMAPKVIRPGIPFDVTVTTLTGSGSTNVVATLLPAGVLIDEGSNHVIDSANADVTANTPVALPLTLPEDTTDGTVTLRVTGSGDVDFEKQTTVEVDLKVLSTFIQSDKAIYKPGETVRFRVVTVYSDLKPYMGKMDIAVFDANSNKVKQFLDVGPGESDIPDIFSSEIKLPGETVLGDWKIEVTPELSEKATKMFEVAEYVLPKFEVKLMTPPYLHDDVPFLINVEAKYTFGKPVPGKVTVKISTYSGVIQQYSNEQLDGDGKYTVTVPKSDLKVGSLYGARFTVTAEVTEETTGKKMLSDPKELTYEQYRYKCEFMEASPTYFKPGLKYVAFVKVTEADGRPPPTSSEKLSVYSSSNDVTYREEFMVPTDGIIAFTVSDIASTVNYLNLKASYRGFEIHKSISKFRAQNDEYLQISIPDYNGPIQPGSTVTFKAVSSHTVSTLSYALISKGSIRHTGTVTGSSMASFDVTIDNSLAQQLSPNARILAWYVSGETFTDIDGGKEKKEVITDSTEFPVDGVFDNQVTLSFDADTKGPSDDVTLTVNADPDSNVAVLAVDQSVLLLKTGNDITQNDVTSELRSYDSNSGSSGGGGGPILFDIWWPYFSGGSDTKSVLDNAGVTVLTDADIYQYSGDYWFVDEDAVFEMAGGGIAEGLPGAVPDEADDSVSTSTDSAATADRVRKDFPESWIWIQQATGTDGTATFQSKVPDTITSWVASAFALNKDTGLGVAKNTATLTVFQPFFVTLNLPYSVIRYERFALEASVFNYLDDEQEVTVTLKTNRDLSAGSENEILSEPMSEDIQLSVKVPAQTSRVVRFWVTPLKIGEILIGMHAGSSQAADALERQLLVEPEGIAQEYSNSYFVQLDADNSMVEETVAVELPNSGLVPDSAKVFVTAIGDVMGTSMNNLDQLLRIPYGCGEQNMINFAPNVFVMKYLESTGQLTNELRGKITDFIESGYLRELNYKHSDGSFSAFGDSDSSGSTWLTAFVAKSFEEAKDLYDINQTHIDVAMDWIIKQQNSETGEFNEPGRVIHTDMQGASAKGLPLTAYVLISLLETKDGLTSPNLRTNAQTAIDKAIDYLVRELDSIKEQPYALSLVYYALNLAEDSNKQTVHDHFYDLAKTEAGTTYWSNTQESDTTPAEGEDEDIVARWMPPYKQSASNDIEMTAYGLLSAANPTVDFDAGLPILKWLVKQRGSLGGYGSTQDTVVGLQALASFAGALHSGDKNVQVTLEYNGNSELFDEITAVNSLILQKKNLPGDVGTFNMKAEGDGVAIIQVTVQYNIMDIFHTGVKLEVISDVTSDNQVHCKICTEWAGNGDSGMFNIDAFSLSGYETNTENLVGTIEGLRKAEKNGKKVTLYLNEITREETCIDLYSDKVHDVENIQEATVVAYAYYQTNKQSIVLYKPETFIPDDPIEYEISGSHMTIAATSFVVILLVLCRLL